MVMVMTAGTMFAVFVMMVVVVTAGAMLAVFMVVVMVVTAGALLVGFVMLVMVMTMFSACGSTDSPAPVSAAPETVVAPTTITIQADGQEITVENANGKTLRQLLEQANITLGE